MDEALSILMRNQRIDVARAKGQVDLTGNNHYGGRCNHVARTLSLRLPLGIIMASERGQDNRA